MEAKLVSFDLTCDDAAAADAVLQFCALRTIPFILLQFGSSASALSRHFWNSSTLQLVSSASNPSPAGITGIKAKAR